MAGSRWKKKGLKEPHEKFLGMYLPCKYVNEIKKIANLKNKNISDVMRDLVHFAFTNGFGEIEIKEYCKVCNKETIFNDNICQSCNFDKGCENEFNKNMV